MVFRYETLRQAYVRPRLLLVFKVFLKFFKIQKSDFLRFFLVSYVFSQVVKLFGSKKSKIVGNFSIRKILVKKSVFYITSSTV